MFKKILQSLSKSQSVKAAVVPPPAAPATSSSTSSPAATPPGKSSGVLDKIMRGAPPTAGLASAKAPQAAEKSPEELCQISAKMSKEQIQARLKLLYRRYNHSASSLDAKIRAEAETMLNAIVVLREKHFGQI
jgi:hypothetical protein